MSRPAGDPRAAELADGLGRVRQRITAACAAAGRSPADVTLVAVTKTYPAADVVRLAGLGVTAVGENRDQEASAKATAVAAAGADVVWHFVGRLQRNKCRSVLRYAGVVHSVDSVPLARALGTAAAAADRGVDVLVQVSVDGDPSRGGAVVGSGDREVDLDRVLAEVCRHPGLRLRGVMAVAPLRWEPEAAFARLAEIATGVRRDHPQATWLSAGMSGDLEAAVAYGSTHVRVGSALLGKRPALG